MNLNPTKSYLEGDGYVKPHAIRRLHTSTYNLLRGRRGLRSTVMTGVRSTLNLQVVFYTLNPLNRKTPKPIDLKPQTPAKSCLLSQELNFQLFGFPSVVGIMTFLTFFPLGSSKP